MSRRFWIHLGLGLALRCVFAAFWNGSYDVYTLARFVMRFERDGLWALYAPADQVYHFGPAVVLLYELMTDVFLRLLHLPLHFAFKLPAIGGDLISAFLLARLGGRFDESDPLRPFLFFWWSPVALLTTAYHGNFDSLHTSLTLAAALALGAGLRTAAGSAAWGGAIVLKKVPILWGISLAASANGSLARRHLLFWGLIPALATFGATLLFAPVPSKVFHAFAYQAAGYGGTWGIGALLSLFGFTPGPIVQSMFDRASIAILVASLALIPLFRRLDPVRAVLLQILVFYVLTVGWGLQYLAWAVPFFALGARRPAILFSGLGGLHLSLAYLQGATKSLAHELSFRSNPWNPLHAKMLEPTRELVLSRGFDVAILLSGLLLWIAFAVWAVRLAREANASPAPVSAA